MLRLLYSWRFYSFGRKQYQECMNNVFNNNLLSLRQVNTIVAVLAACFSLYPLLFEKNVFMMCIYLVVALIAMLTALYTNYKMQVQQENNRFIYVLISVFFANIILFGIYLNVWSSPDKLASIFLCFLICGLLMFVNPPLFNLCLIFGAVVVFIVSTVIMKTPDNFIADIINVSFAGVISIYFNWHITKLRLGLEISATMLEDERNKYLDQSTIDELTKLKNRRDFEHTFKRYQSNYRTSDDWLCVAICDIDFFKNYNDHYGHPMGDECLRSVGRVLDGLMDSMSVYAARVGGEEFAMLWFEKDASHVDKIVSHVSGAIAGLKIPHEKSKVSKFVTISIGIYVERCGSPNDTKTLYNLADKALYTAKGSGRNCAIVCGEEIKEYKITA